METIRNVRSSYPELKILAISGVTLRGAYLEVAARLGANATLEKSAVPAHLLQTVCSLIET